MLVLFLSILIILIIGAPIAVALGMSSSIYFIVEDFSLRIIPQRMFGATESFPLLAVPFFILAGNLMAHGGISRRIINFANAVVGTLAGGLALVSIVAGMIFAAISGSGAAATAALATIMIPAMTKLGYDKNFSAAVQATAGSLGIIIPPSVPLILYGISAGVSVADLFIAGILPGIFIGLLLCIVAYIVSLKKGYRLGESSTVKYKITTFFDAMLALLMPVIILGGIYSGIFTPTEAGVIAVAYGFIISTVVYREVNLSNLSTILSNSVITSSIVMFIIATAALFGAILTREMIPQQLAETFLALTENPIVFLIICNIFLLIIGTFVETAAAIILLTPILTPLAVQLGIDPVHFGIIMIMNLAIGLTTPPVGINLYVASNIANTRIESSVRYLIPFLITSIIGLLIISYFEDLSLIILRLTP